MVYGVSGRVQSADQADFDDYFDPNCGADSNGYCNENADAYCDSNFHENSDAHSHSNSDGNDYAAGVSGLWLVDPKWV